MVNWVGARDPPQPAMMLDLKLAVGCCVLWGQDPDVEVLGPEYYKLYLDDHAVSLILGVGAAFLAESTPEEVAERVRRYVTVGWRGGRFALYLCNLGASTPPLMFGCGRGGPRLLDAMTPPSGQGAKRLALVRIFI